MSDKPQINYTPNFDGFKPPASNDKLPGGDYVVELSPEVTLPNGTKTCAEWYDATVDRQYAGEGVGLSVRVRVVEATPGSKARVGETATIKIKGFGVVNPMNPEKSKDLQAKDKLAKLLCAVYKQAPETIETHGNAVTAHFMQGGSVGQRFRVVGTEKNSKAGFSYTLYKFSAVG
jgi:hypothetical protein